MKLKPSSNTRIDNLVDFLDHVQASLNADYDHLFEHTRPIIDEMPEKTRNRNYLEWNLVHIHTTLNALLTDIRRHQELLRKE